MKCFYFTRMSHFKWAPSGHMFVPGQTQREKNFQTSTKRKYVYEYVFRTRKGCCPPSKVAKSTFMGTLIEQPPQAQIRSNAKYLCAHQIANDKTIILSTEKVQKVHSRPKLWSLKRGVAKLAKTPWQVPSLNSCHGNKLGRNSKFLCSSDSQWPDDWFEQWKCPKRPKLRAFENKLLRIGGLN